MPRDLSEERSNMVKTGKSKKCLDKYPTYINTQHNTFRTESSNPMIASQKTFFLCFLMNIHYDVTGNLFTVSRNFN